MPRSRLLLAIVAAAAASTMIAPSANARVVFKEHYTDTQSHIEQEEHGDEFCPNVEFPVLFEGEIRGTLLVKTKGSGPFPYFADHFQTTDVYTNLENDKSLTIVSNSRFADQTIVDNGDGTITITVKGTGRQFAYGPDGNRLFVDAGQTQFSFVIDYNGTPDNPDDDVEVADLGEHKLTGRQDTADRDFCEDLVTFLG
jgi:hypothetical protein